jgi:short-subunit dehydrogenase
VGEDERFGPFFLFVLTRSKSSWYGIMKRDPRGQRILITGASQGIGRALAEQLAAAGARLLLAARSEERLGELAETLRTRDADVVAVPADVTREADRTRLFDAAREHFRGLDVLINNAGISSFGHFADSTEEILRQVMEVNFFAPAELIRAALPLLREGRQPAVVNVASMCGRRAMPAWAEYSASKYALCGLTEALRGELARFAVDVLLVVPGLTASDFQKNMLRNEGRMRIDFASGLTSAQTAAGIVQALRLNRTETVLGGDARWMLRVNRFFPRLLDRLIARRVRKLYAQDVGWAPPTTAAVGGAHPTGAQGGAQPTQQEVR